MNAAGIAPRHGLGGVVEALRTRACRIAFLGASVSAQRDGYASRLHGELVRRTGPAHQAIPAALGATGSLAGAHYMDLLLAGRRPDLCFVEFTTTDVSGYTPPDEIAPAAEGIVRKLARLGCQPVLLHLVRRDVAITPAHPVVRTWEAVAEHYAIPSIHVAVALEDAVRLLRDDVHTTPEGSDRLARLIADAVLGPLAVGPGLAARPLPPPLRPDAYDRARIEPVQPGWLEPPARARRGRFRLGLEYLELGAGEELAFEVSGRLSGAMVVVGPDSGIVEFVEPGSRQRISLFDEHCHYERLSAVHFGGEYPAATPVRLRMTDAFVDRSVARRPVADPGPAGQRLKIVGLLQQAPPAR